MGGMFWVGDLGYLGDAEPICEAGNSEHRDPGFREEKGESVHALCLLQNRACFLIGPAGGSRALNSHWLSPVQLHSETQVPNPVHCPCPCPCGSSIRFPKGRGCLERYGSLIIREGEQDG